MMIGSWRTWPKAILSRLNQRDTALISSPDTVASAIFLQEYRRSTNVFACGPREPFMRPAEKPVPSRRPRCKPTVVRFRGRGA
jgi:hypothetical protein